MRRLIKNSIKCKRCGDVLVSEHVHDYKVCECGAVSCDGGLLYLRRGFKYSQDDYVELSEYEKDGSENDGY